jgi:alpha-glucoside transport system permease protein
MSEQKKSVDTAKPTTSILISIGRLAVSILIPLIAFAVLWAGFIFLRDSNAPQTIIGLVAIIWGVGGIALLFWIADYVVNRMPLQVAKKIQPFVFVGPALAILAWYLFIPTLRSFYLSFFGPQSNNFVGLKNYIYAFTDPTMLTAFRNNFLWIILGTGGAVGFGLIIALLADRSKLE